MTPQFYYKNKQTNQQTNKKTSIIDNANLAPWENYKSIQTPYVINIWGTIRKFCFFYPMENMTAFSCTITTLDWESKKKKRERKYFFFTVTIIDYTFLLMINKRLYVSLVRFFFNRNNSFILMPRLLLLAGKYTQCTFFINLIRLLKPLFISCVENWYLSHIVVCIENYWHSLHTA